MGVRRWRWLVAGALLALLSGAVSQSASAQDDAAADGFDHGEVIDFVRAEGMAVDGSMVGGGIAADLANTAPGDCLESVHADTQFDTPFFDIVAYGAGSFADTSCGAVAFAAVTRDFWPTDELGLFVAFIDIDASPGTGCDGADYALGATPVNGILTAAMLRTPTCESSTWDSMPVSVDAGRTAGDDIGVAVDSSFFVRGRSFRWSLGLLSIFDDLDLAPDGSSHLDSLGGSSGPATCFGQTATIIAQPNTVTVGTPGPDVILGTQGRDQIRGGGGGDRICSLGGNDVVDGGAGNDLIDLGGGADRSTGGAGADRILGQGGDDLIEGNKGNDQLLGGPGNDELRGGPGNDVANGQGGSDAVAGQGGRDRLHGGGKNDAVTGGPGQDLVLGNGGADILRGGGGPDTLGGGGGNDRLFGDGGNDRLNGNAGRDTCRGGPGSNQIRACEA